MNTSNFRPATPSGDLIELQPNNSNKTADGGSNLNLHESEAAAASEISQNFSSNSDLYADEQLIAAKLEPQQSAASECDFSDSEYLPNNPYYPFGGNDSDIGASGGAVSDIDDDEFLDNPFDESHNYNKMATALHPRLFDMSTYHQHQHQHQHHLQHPSMHPAQSMNPYSYALRPPSSSEMHYSYNYLPPNNRRNLMGPPAGYNQHQPHHATGSGFPPHFWYPNSSHHGYYSSPNTKAAAAAGVSHLHGHHLGHYPPPQQPPPPQAHHYGTHPSHMHLHHNHHLQSESMCRGHHDQLVDMLQMSNSCREARNRAEKNRRDKLNGSIQELSAMVPHVAESPRRVDKTAILRFSAHGLRVHYVFGQSIKEPPERKPQLTETLMKLLDSFHMTITCHGQIVLISATVEQHLGHCQTDLYGQNIMNITHPDDQAMLRRQLIPTDLENLFDVQPEDENGEPRPRTSEEEAMIDRQLKADTRSFTIRLARAGPRTEPTTYEVVRIDGCFRRADAAPRGVKCSNFPSGLQLIRRARGRDDNIPLHSISGNDIVLVGMVRLIRPPKLNTRIMEANSFEYQTRHLIDGRIIDCDQRIGLVAGYMKGEVTGLSPFTFMHQDDVRWVIVALRQMYDCKSDYGESCYRLLTRNNRFIYLQTKGFLEIDKETNKVHSFVCINTLVSDEEGRRRVQEMKNKFSLIINTKIPLSSSLDIPASENPQQLEKAVLCLIQNLQKNGDDDENDASTSNTHYQTHQDSHKDSSQTASGMSPAAVRAASSCSIRSTKTPPLALIPPEADTVKSSISKSVDVVAKNMRSARGMQSPQSSPMSPVVNRDEASSDSTSTNGSGVQNRPSVLQRISSVKSEEPPSTTTVKVKEEEFFHSPQSRVPPLPNSTCSCFYETGGPQNDCISCQEFALITSPPPTADVPLPRQFRSPGSSSVLKRTHSESSSDGRVSPSADTEDHDQRTQESPKRRLIYNETAGKEICQVISNSFQQINRSLNHIESATTELRGQCNNFTLPNTDLKLNEIFEEHQRQQKMLVSIKSEFEANLQSTPFIDTPVIVDQTLALNRPVEESFSPKNDLKPR